ncbi:cell division protein FtsQ/DivIB [Lentilactobacillus raoultii]|uniref:Cell division protein DivIB n=1 Tax=Lentilactobacillus raoultii TaxID=1987503 RepID=A0ABW3PIF4_9LACO|nr:cell division protein FtsQ/DivIB [Lentilactobacillus raoultii]
MGKRNDHEEGLTPWQEAADKDEKKSRKKRRHPFWFLKGYQIRNFKRMSPLIILFIVIICIMSFLVSPISRVQQIKISGNEIVSVKQIKHYSPVKKGMSLLSVWGKTDQLANRLKQRSQRMQSVKIRLVHFNQIDIRVEEYPTIGYLYTNGGYQPILKSGVIIQNKVLNPRDGFPILKKFKNAHTLRRTIQQYRRISPPVRAVINTISYSPVKSNRDRVFLQMNDGNRVYASIASFGDKMDYYPSINSRLKVKSVINLEVGAYSYPITKHQTKNKS